MSRAVAELYSALVMVAVTLALSYVVFAHLHLVLAPQPVFVASMLQRYGSPSVLRLSVNSSGPTSANEFRIDRSSSLDGVLTLSGGGYTTSQSLCGPGATTFFSVDTGNGTLSVSGAGAVSIDGTEESSAQVIQGWHEVMISNASVCGVTLPGGSQLAYPSSQLSTIPLTQDGPQSFTFLVPFTDPGHTITISFNGGIETCEF
jgi:hypothetical protein